jgi:tRNA1(Val) A37 N6-methylase TrmN6
VNILLSENGRFGIILPMDAAEKLEKLMTVSHLFATKKNSIFPAPGKNANRMMMMFERKFVDCEEGKLTIRDNGYTNEYYQLVKEYLTINN